VVYRAGVFIPRKRCAASIGSIPMPSAFDPISGSYEGG